MPYKYDTCPQCGNRKDVRAKKCAECQRNRGPQTTMEQRFWMKVDRRGPDECWPWKGTKLRHGYGVLYKPGKTSEYVRAHRFSWSLVNGPIPDGMVICHRCDNPNCVNPAHLFVGSIADNNHDRNAKGRDGRAVGEANGAHTHPEKVARGSGHYAARLTDAQVAAIRLAKPATGVHQAAARVADEYGISKAHVIHIWYGYKWKHLETPPGSIKRRNPVL